MPIVICSPTGETRSVESQPYTNEDELQAAVANSPSLLQDEGDARLVLVKREVALPNAGYLDILAVDANGLPVAIEVKLARSDESRRLVVAQIVDYVASLTRLTVNELDRAVGGELDKALHKFDGTSESADGEDQFTFDQRWEQVDVNLRAGRARIVVVLDEERSELLNIVRFLAEHSDFDIRLVAVSKYVTADIGTFFVPSMLLSGATRAQAALAAPATGGYAKLLEIAAAYASMPIAASVPVFGNARSYRMVRPTDWPWQWRIHYEFLLRNDIVGVELHLESDLAAQRTQRILRDLAGTQVGPAHRPLAWDPLYYANRGRLRVTFAVESAEPSEVAQTMASLIILTQERVTQLMQPDVAASAAT